MGLTTLIIASFLTSYVVSDSCVTYNFEENLNDIVGGYGLCSGIPAWVLDEYSNLNLDSPDERSTKFITPPRDGNTKCWSSSVFTISPGGTLEVKLYINSDTMATVDVIVAGEDTTHLTGYRQLNSQDIKGWYLIDLPLYPSSTIKAYISIFSRASASAIVLVDSLRYIPPGMNETLCQIYEDLATTPEPTTTSQPTTTPKPITTPELTTTKPTTPRPTTTIEPTVTSPESTTTSPDVRPPTDAEDNTSFWNKIIITINNTININNLK
ncbi:platelet glycoprotein Ib alpha chain-like [Spodoptera litura]|uniref:Platelet glycoprotein Ib alpha chain-like n=1 Tax=Spodoptera litura TaxID=69820 RepID=A0A9J7EA41_SPOLT|nr:platelet glycoprotein Ib alpha chain-like [Spodoptera litura]